MTEFCHLLFVYHIAEGACPGKCLISRIGRLFYVISSGILAIFPDGVDQRPWADRGIDTLTRHYLPFLNQYPCAWVYNPDDLHS